MSDETSTDESPKPIPGRCGSPRKDRKRGFCKSYPVSPCSVEKEWLVPTRCKMHGGLQQAMHPDDPRRAGAPVRTGLGTRLGERVDARSRAAEAYARHLTDRAMLDAYVSPEFRLGTLDADLQLARAYLVGAMRRQQKNPNGGTVIQSGNVTKVRLHSDVVAEWLDLIRRIETSRAKLANASSPHDDDLLGHEAWLQTTQSESPEHEHEGHAARSSSSVSSPPTHSESLPAGASDSECSTP